MVKLQDASVLDNFELQGYQNRIYAALTAITRALEKYDASAALEICRSEATLDAYYRRDCDRVKDMLRQGGNAENTGVQHGDAGI